MRPRRRLPFRLLAPALAAALCALVPLSVWVRGPFASPGELAQGLLAAAGWGQPIETTLQTIAELRLWRALTAAGVGACLALSGGLLQGLFRNGLASPSILGVTGGASLGAAAAILLVGGYAPSLVVSGGLGPVALLIPLLGFLGALGAALTVAFLGSVGGRTSVATLLLVGVAVNMVIAGIFAAVQYLTLADWEVSRAILAWTFGTLDDRSAFHGATAWGGLALAAAAIPFVARELDLLQAGEEDARGLGVDTGAVKLAAIAAAALAASAAVAVAGQIAFVGLVVPHLVRLTSGRRHGTLLPLCILGGAVFLLGADVLQRAALGSAALQPGVMMSLVGGPFFLLLLVRARREIRSW